MTIYDPVPRLDSNRQRLIVLLSKLLEESLNYEKTPSNKPLDSIVLTSGERIELAELLDSALAERPLFVGLSFVEGIAGINQLSEEQLREIYLSERKRFGRTRALASKQWADFLARLGRQSGWSKWGAEAFPMTYMHFLEMERRLFTSLNLSKKVSDHLLDIVTKSKKSVDLALAQGHRLAAKIPLEEPTKRLAAAIRNMLNAEVSEQLSKSQVSGLIVVLANTSVLFTTRDWSAAGTMSAIAGGSWQVISKD